jgi:hypothetical protein
VLGRPEFTGKEEDTGVPLITYSVDQPFHGFLYVSIRRGRLVGLSLGLKDPIDTGEIPHLFGNGYRVVRYDFDDCLGIGGSAPIYESATGSIEEMEYPELGVYVTMDSGRGREIVFTDRPPGRAHSVCAARHTHH